jgi:hypothetical protein
MKFKKFIKYQLIITALFVTAISQGFSQGGSNYSIFGFGDFLSGTSSGYEGTAGTAVALPNETSINFVNPALISLINTTRLQVGYRFNQNVASDGNSSIWQNNGGINAISMVFAFDTARKISASFGLLPVSKVNYYISKKFVNPFTEEKISGFSLYKGNGGLSAFYATLSGKIISGLHLGGTLYGNFGSIDYYNAINYDESYAYTTYFKQTDYFSGLGYKIGLYYELPYNFAIGGYFQDFGKLSLERERTYGSDLLVDSTFNDKLDVTAPKSMGFGISWQTGKFSLGADYKILDVANMDYGFSANNTFQNSSEISFGIVRKGNYRTNAPLADRTSYRLGFAYSNLYYEVAQNKINEMKFTFGAGVPFANSGILDAAFVFGKRGTTDKGLVNEYFGRLVIDISIGEGWFHPFKREY